VSDAGAPAVRSLPLAGSRRRERPAWLSPGYLFIAPALLVVLLFFALPALSLFYLAFAKWRFTGAPEWVGLANFAELWGDEVFWKVLGNTVFYVLATVPPMIVLGLALALAVEAMPLVKTAMRTVFFMPVITSIAVASVVWSLLYNPSIGLINGMLSMIGVDGPSWMSDPAWALTSLAILAIWKGFGYSMTLFIAGLAGIDQTLHEAAMIDGAGSWTRFWRITWPLLSPTTFFVVIVGLLGSFQVFASVALMTKGGPSNASNVLVYFIYEEAFHFQRYGVGSAASLLLLIFSAVLTALYLRGAESRVHYQ
jgi:multiple sugar transport system permease protein